MDAIPGEIALQLRVESRQENRHKRYTPAAMMGLGCWKSSKG
jgi:hypothetical protein